MFKYDKSKINAAREEKEASCHRDNEVNQGLYMYHSSVISSSLPISRVFYNQQ